MLADNWKGAGAAGVIRGAYHFLRPEDDAVAQADFFVATAGVPQKGDLPLALDLEVSDNLTGAAVAMNAAQFLARVQEKTGRAPVVYTSARFWTEIAGPATGYDGYALWDAHWTTACPNIPPAWMSWTFWQNAATGTIPGISGSANVDLDEFNGSLAALQAWVDGDTADGGSDGVDGGASDDAGATNAAHHGGCSLAGAGARGQNSNGARGNGALVLVAVALALVATARACRRTRRTATASAPTDHC
jgi:lysozyme